MKITIYILIALSFLNTSLSIRQASVESLTKRGGPFGVCFWSHKEKQFWLAGRGWDPAKFGPHGNGLRQRLSECTGIKEWAFVASELDPLHAWWIVGKADRNAAKCLEKKGVLLNGGWPPMGIMENHPKCRREW